MDDRVGKKLSDPVLVARTHQVEAVAVVPARHAQQVAHLHIFQVPAHRVRQLVRKERNDLVVEAEPSFADGDGDSQRIDGLADRIDVLGLSGCAFVHPSLCDHVSVVENHQAVLFDPGFFYFGQVLPYGCPEGGIRLSPGQGVSVFARGRVLGRRIDCMCAYGQGADDAEKG